MWVKPGHKPAKMFDGVYFIPPIYELAFTLLVHVTKNYGTSPFSSWVNQLFRMAIFYVANC